MLARRNKVTTGTSQVVREPNAGSHVSSATRLQTWHECCLGIHTKRGVLAASAGALTLKADRGHRTSSWRLLGSLQRTSAVQKREHHNRSLLTGSRTVWISRWHTDGAAGRNCWLPVSSCWATVTHHRAATNRPQLEACGKKQPVSPGVCWECRVL